jgi:hypothetical protein
MKDDFRLPSDFGFLVLLRLCNDLGQSDAYTDRGYYPSGFSFMSRCSGHRDGRSPHGIAIHGSTLGAAAVAVES